MSTPSRADPFADLAALPAAERDRIALFRLLVVVGNALRTRMDRRLSPRGVTTQQAALLTIVLDAPRPPSFGEAAARLGCSHQNVKQLATALARKGLLLVSTDPADARVRRLAPLPGSRAPFCEHERTDRDAVLQWFAALPDAQVATMLDGLLRLMDGAEDRAGPGAAP